LQKAILQQNGVKEAAILLRESPSGEKTLIAYVVPANRQRAAEAEVLQALRAKLPPSEIAPVVVVVDALPRTNSGAIDYERLPAWRQLETPPQKPVKARSPTEKLLAQIWCEVIGLDEVGVHDNFFDLGGHSVLVTQIVGRIRKLFDVNVGLRTVFERPTIAELAETIEGLLVEEISQLSEEEALRL